MKNLTFIFAILLANAASSQTINPGAVGSSVETLNQLTPETANDGTKIQNPEEQQDEQERIYWENKKREAKEWEKQKQKDDSGL